MTHEQSGDAHWVMWIGAWQWEGLPGEFDVGQAGWVCPKDDQVNFFRFFPALGSGYGWSYQVACMAKDFLRFTTFENA